VTADCAALSAPCFGAALLASAPAAVAAHFGRFDAGALWDLVVVAGALEQPV